MLKVKNNKRSKKRDESEPGSDRDRGETEMSQIQRRDNYLATNVEALATDEAIYRETEDVKKEVNQMKPPKDFYNAFRFDQ